MDHPQIAAMMIGLAAVALAIVLAWRAFGLSALAPECEPLATSRGVPKSVVLARSLFADWRLEFEVGPVRFRSPRGPWTGRLYRALRSGVETTVAYCPSRGRARPWSVTVGTTAAVGVPEQRHQAHESAKTSLAGSILLLAIGGMLVRVGIPARRRNG